jgi:hypothetical protein
VLSLSPISSEDAAEREERLSRAWTEPWSELALIPINAGCSDRTRSPVIAPAARVSWTVKYLTLAAKRTSGAGGKKGAPTAGLARVRRLLGVVIQLAPLALGGA